MLLCPQPREVVNEASLLLMYCIVRPGAAALRSRPRNRRSAGLSGAPVRHLRIARGVGKRHLRAHCSGHSLSERLGQSCVVENAIMRREQ